MKSAALFALAATFALNACSSSANKAPPTPSPKATKVVAVSTQPSSTPHATAQVSSSDPVRKTSGSAYAHGRADLRGKQFQAAKQQFETAISQGQNLPGSYEGLGTASVALGNFKSALRSYRAAANLQPNNPGFLYNVAYAALYARDYKTSVAYAGLYIRARPREVSGYHLRLLANGALLIGKKEVPDAEMIVRLQPHNADAYNDLGIALANSGKYKQSATAFTRAITLRPRNLSFFTNRAMAENLNKQQTLALADLQRARSMATDSATQKRIDLAIKNLKKFMRHT